MKLFDLFNKKKESSLEQSGCQNAKKVAYRYGYQIICPEDEMEEKQKVDEGCANAQKVASKYGYTVICPEE